MATKQSISTPATNTPQVFGMSQSGLVFSCHADGRRGFIFVDWQVLSPSIECEPQRIGRLASQQKMYLPYSACVNSNG